MGVAKPEEPKPASVGQAVLTGLVIWFGGGLVFGAPIDLILGFTGRSVWYHAAYAIALVILAAASIYGAVHVRQYGWGRAPKSKRPADGQEPMDKYDWDSAIGEPPRQN